MVIQYIVFYLQSLMKTVSHQALVIVLRVRLGQGTHRGYPIHCFLSPVIDENSQSSSTCYCVEGQVGPRNASGLSNTLFFISSH